jgi:hypothetical protein
MRSYCHDVCPNNRISRLTVEETDADGKKKSFTSADKDRNKRLQCALGYKQMVNSKTALVHSEENGTRVCANLRSVLSLERPKRARINFVYISEKA